jgi:hypothetical protein
MTAEFHQTFWVVAGTAAPIIGLAAVITVGEARETIAALSPAPPLRGIMSSQENAARTARQMAIIAYFISYLNVGLQGFVLLTALVVLRSGSDAAGPLSPNAAIVILTGGMLALAGTAIFLAFMRVASRQAAEPERPLKRE